MTPVRTLVGCSDAVEASSIGTDGDSRLSSGGLGLGVESFLSVVMAILVLSLGGSSMVSVSKPYARRRTRSPVVVWRRDGDHGRRVDMPTRGPRRECRAT